jgi:hypothetical protein
MPNVDDTAALKASGIPDATATRSAFDVKDSWRDRSTEMISERSKDFAGMSSDDPRAIGWLRARVELAGGNFAAMTDAELRSVSAILFAIHSGT